MSSKMVARLLSFSV